MPRSEQELTELMTKIQDNFEKIWKEGDAKKLAELYHPEGVLVCTGKWAVHGRKDIEEKYAPLVGPSLDFKVRFALLKLKLKYLFSYFLISIKKPLMENTLSTKAVLR